METSKIRNDAQPVAMSYLSRAMLLYEMDDTSSVSTPPSVAAASTDSQSTSSSSSRLCISSATSSVSDASTWRRQCKQYSRSSSSANRLRSNLLYKLGVTSIPTKTEAQTTEKSKTHKLMALDRSISYTQSIRFGDEDPDSDCVFSPFLDEQDSLPVEPAQRSISFREEVHVVPIPLHTDYSERVRQRLWSGSSEIYANAQRNTIEFASESWNWRSVKEEEHFFRCQHSGNLVHPAHICPPTDIRDKFYQPN